MNNALYNLKSKKKLSKLLYLESYGHCLESYSFVNNYNVFIHKSANSEGTIKKRLIESPAGKLEDVHKRVFKLLSRINLPEYVISKRGKSYVDNYKRHKENPYILTLDIEKFFPSCSFTRVYHFFHSYMQMSADAAYVISNILTIDYSALELPVEVENYMSELKNDNITFPNQHIPTGSSISTLLSFLAYKEMFDTLYSIAKSRNYEMSLYVDDLTFSSKKPIPTNFITEVKRVVSKYDLRLNNKKKKLLQKEHNKNITGVIMNKNMVPKIPNKLHLKYKNAKNNYIQNPTPKNKQKLTGIKEAMKQITSSSKPK